MTRIKNLTSTLLSDNWYTLRKYHYEYLNRDGAWESVDREAYDRGNGATILLYDPARATVILTRQFRLPTYLNGNPDGMLIESCAGLLDEDDPKTAIIRETLEETGYRVENLEPVGEMYMSPGSVTERVHFFIGTYTPQQRASSGGGVAEETEDIEVLELNYDEALRMIERGEIRDGKTVLLLYHLRVKGVM